MPGLREALEDRFDEIDGDVAPEQAPVAAELEVEQEEQQQDNQAEQQDEQQSDGRARDDQGRFARTEAEKSAASAKAGRAPAAGKVAGAARQGQVIPPAGAAPAAPVRAPQSWKPALRELAGRLPPEFRPLLEEVNRREKETTVALQRAAEAGKGAQPWQEAIRPYEAQIRAAGTEPVKYVGDLLQAAHTLSYAQPAQRADKLAELALQFGVDVQQLDQALTRRIQGGGQRSQQQVQPQPSTDPRQAVREMFQELAGKHQAQVAEDRVGKFASDPKHEFFPDVAGQMQAWLDGLSQQGRQEVSDEEFERAYNAFCMMDPEIAPILEQRREAEAAKTALAATSQARRAASSVRSQPVVATATQPRGLRGALEAKYDELNEG